jgi:hypothetical protein
MVFNLLMVIDDLDLLRSAFRPDKAYPVLVVDPNAVLAAPPTLKQLQAISGWSCQIFQLSPALSS